MALSCEQLHEKISEICERHHEDLIAVCGQIHGNPEIGYREFKAHDGICDLMSKLDYRTTRHAYGLETSFEVESGKGGALVIFNAEYDALPGLGHACGHNLIATSSIAAFLATAEILHESALEGRVRLLGTPAEEAGGGKIRLMDAGAYDGATACLMAHPTGLISSVPGSKVDGLASVRSSARRQLKAHFCGQSAHAGTDPWLGKNALDAVVSSYVNISLLRQQLQPSARVQGTIRQGGDEPNLIPDSTLVEYHLREINTEQIEELSRKVEACFEAGALAIGCELECTRDAKQDYAALRPNTVMSAIFAKHMGLMGKHFHDDVEMTPMGASTDMGNITEMLPGIHPMFYIGTDDPLVQPHTPGFAAVTGNRVAFEAAIECSKGLAATAYDLLRNPNMLSTRD